MLRESQQRVRDAAFDLLGRHLDDAGMGVLQAAADRLQRIRG